MKQQNSSKPQDDHMVEMAFKVLMACAIGFVAISAATIAIPSLVLGNLLYWAWNSKPERQLSRTALVFTMWFVAVYYLVGPPHTDSLQSVGSNIWPGALFSDFWSWFSKIYGQLHSSFLQYFKVDHRNMVNQMRVIFYAPLLGAIIVAVLFAFKKFKRNTAGLYNGLRALMSGTTSLVLRLPEKLSQGSKRPFLTYLLVMQNFIVWGSLRIVVRSFLPTLGWIIGVVGCAAIVTGLHALYVVWGGSKVEAEEGEDTDTRPDRVPLGRNENYDEVALTIPQLEHHVHVLGASGSGKSTLLSHLIGHHIRAGLGIIFVDLKSDMDTVKEITARCKAAGRLESLRVLDISRPDLSLPYNPCKRGNATEIKDKIVGAFDWENEYYKNKSQSFLLTVLRALVFMRDQGRQQFGLEDVYLTTESSSGTGALGALHLELEKANADSVLREEIMSLSRSLKSREFSKDIEGLRTQLKLLLDSEFGTCLRNLESGIDFFNSIQNREIVYVLLDSQSYGETAKRLGKLILQDLKACSGEIVKTIPASERTHCTIVVDEFADLATEQFVGLLNRARGSKLGIVVAHQEIADLDAISPALRDQVMGNTSTTVSFLQKNAESAERLAQLAGTKRVTKQTRQIEEADHLIFKSQKPTGILSEREVEEFRIHPNRIKELKRGQCVIVGKYPEAWSAEVSVYVPEKWEMNALDAEVELRRINEAVTSRPMPQWLHLRGKRKAMEVKPTPAAEAPLETVGATGTDPRF